MLLELPRLTNSIRLPFDVDQAYLNRKSFLKNLKPHSSTSDVGESELARKIVYRWDEASFEIRQAYKQYVSAIVELMGGEVVSEEFHVVALNAYRLFCGITGAEEDENDKRIFDKKFELQKLVGHTVPDANLLKVASLVERLSILQTKEHGTVSVPELIDDDSSDDIEFGADLDFRHPLRFLVDEDSETLVEETSTSSHWSDYNVSANFRPVNDSSFDLEWLRDSCDKIVKESASHLPRDELAMAICQVLDSEKPGDEIAGDLLDLVGDGSFEIVQDLIMHRKELVENIHRGLLGLKSDKSASSTQQRIPSYATQVTVHTESERQIDKLRRKEEKRHRRGIDHGIETELSSLAFSSLLQASEKKNLFDDLVGHGNETQLAATALPKGTVRKHFKGYEKVTIAPTPTAPMKPDEKLVYFII